MPVFSLMVDGRSSAWKSVSDFGLQPSIYINTKRMPDFKLLVIRFLSFRRNNENVRNWYSGCAIL